MKVYQVVPRGYCKGVVRAIRIAKETALQTKDKPVYILGMIVHNQHIVDALSQLGIKTIDDKFKTRSELLDQIDNGTVIFSAHGVGENVFEKARNKNLDIIDATCVDVVKTHDLIKKVLKDGYEVLYIGKMLHPEAEGTLSIDKNKIHLIESINDIDKFISSKQKYIITNQTTMGLYDVFNIMEYALKNLNNIELAQEICTATKVRQEAIANIPDEVDLVYIVGDPHSNNTNKLKKIASEKWNVSVFLIENVHDINIDDLRNKEYLAVSSGASTPTYLTNQIISYLEQIDFCDEKTLIKPSIDKDRILD